jgi:hypothetical protein
MHCTSPNEFNIMCRVASKMVIFPHVSFQSAMIKDRPFGVELKFLHFPYVPKMPRICCEIMLINFSAILSDDTMALLHGSFVF